MLRWGLIGGVAGAVLALLVFAPAAWLAGAVADASDGRLLLAQARGTVWNGSAVLVLTGGAGSRDASALPGRVDWTLSIDGLALALRARQDCCINGEMQLRVRPGWGRVRVELTPAVAARGALGQWPASWLIGLGTPWNTLQPAGTLRLTSPGLAVEQVQGRWLFDGQAVLDLQSIASRVSTLDELGNYRLTLSTRGEAARLQLDTLRGALQLSGSGQWVAGRLRFRGEARAAEGAEAVLANLLNIIGRRQGAASIISIG